MNAEGVLCLYKEEGFTSHDAVNRVRRLFGTKQVGHTGTLDPLATGVLVVLVGRAAKAAEYLGADSKEYTATLKLGVTYDTEDTTGTLLTRHEGPFPTAEEVERVCERFTGDIQQVPPMYSALKINGQKLVDLARKNIEVERQARKIHVHSLTVTATDAADEYILRACVSAGTYIRTLCADIGAALGCGGAMHTLRRERCGLFGIEGARTLGELEEMSEDERLSCLMPTEELFADCPALTLPAFFERLAHSGQQLYQKKIGTDYPTGTRVRLCGKDGFFALGEVREYEEGSAVKPIKQFVL